MFHHFCWRIVEFQTDWSLRHVLHVAYVVIQDITVLKLFNQKFKLIIDCRVIQPRVQLISNSKAQIMTKFLWSTFWKVFEWVTNLLTYLLTYLVDHGVVMKSFLGIPLLSSSLQQNMVKPINFINKSNKSNNFTFSIHDGAMIKPLRTMPCSSLVKWHSVYHCWVSNRVVSQIFLQLLLSFKPNGISVKIS